MELTPKLNAQSIEGVRLAIQRKNGSSPYFSNGTNIMSSVTDMDHHPYGRFFRGVYYYPDPVVFEREAGWRPLENSCYETVIPEQYRPYDDPQRCWEVPCSTTLPCYKDYLKKYSDKEQLDVTLNQSCIIQYR